MPQSQHNLFKRDLICDSLEISNRDGLLEQLALACVGKFAVPTVKQIGHAGFAKARDEIDLLRTVIAAMAEERFQFGLEAREAVAERLQVPPASVTRRCSSGRIARITVPSVQPPPTRPIVPCVHRCR